MHDELWRRLVLMESRGRLTRIDTQWTYDQVLEWTKDTFGIKHGEEHDHDLVMIIHTGNLKSFTFEGMGGSFRQDYDDAFMMSKKSPYALFAQTSTNPKNPHQITWWKDPASAMLFKLAQD